MKRMLFFLLIFTLAFAAACGGDDDGGDTGDTGDTGAGDTETVVTEPATGGEEETPATGMDEETPEAGMGEDETPEADMTGTMDMGEDETPEAGMGGDETPEADMTGTMDMEDETPEADMTGTMDMGEDETPEFGTEDETPEADMTGTMEMDVDETPEADMTGTVEEDGTPAAGDAGAAVAMGEPVELGELTITVEGTSQIEGGQALGPEEGNQFLGVEVTIENASSSPVRVLQLLSQMQVETEGGEAHDVSLTATALASTQGEGLPQPAIQAGEEATGMIGFEVPDDASGLVLVIESADEGGDPVMIELDTGQ